ncbi:ATP-binding protein [Aquincola tertiaricarbonis]|uniref:histidine kinase n=1 Tax=Aquincola tertiaricarbonis TaxID=391953 RepID=A0ABY4SBW8_AQUTE|nr:ATP-binding protein [Aquincola tertiaricarbonis]URI08541.1 ATP-binding protein [Aquincola tertiaricarbonis]
MAGLLDRIWVRFGLAIALAVLVTIALLSACLLLVTRWQYEQFYSGLPVQVQRELDSQRQLNPDPMDNPQIADIYSRYWRADPLYGERMSMLLGLAFCLPVGMAAGLWLSRAVSRPLASMAEAANRIALGDFSVRAEVQRERGELADMLRNFNRMTDSLQALEEERRHTVAVLSHELRTPLTVLTARLHALRDGILEPEPAEISRLLGEVDHLSRLVADMHTLALADAGRLTLQRVRFDLAELAAEVVAVFEGRLRDGGPSLQLQRSGPVPVHADRDRTRQVLSNLLDNALRHAAGATQVLVSVGSEPGMGLLVVADDGPGLPSAVSLDARSRFQSMGSSAGSGLGLSIVQALVSGQGGSVHCRRGPGGAHFSVRLPAAPPGPAAAAG